MILGEKLKQSNGEAEVRGHSFVIRSKPRRQDHRWSHLRNVFCRTSRVRNLRMRQIVLHVASASRQQLKFIVRRPTYVRRVPDRHPAPRKRTYEWTRLGAPLRGLGAPAAFKAAASWVAGPSCCTLCFRNSWFAENTRKHECNFSREVRLSSLMSE